MSALPARDEKNAIVAPSRDHVGWKSPPGPCVRGRAEPPPAGTIQTFISPARSELNAIWRPSGDHDPRLSSRVVRSEEHTSELQSQSNLVCRLLLEKKN